MKEEILKLWDKDYSELGGETFNESWLDDPVKVLQLENFLFRMWGHISDGTHHLEGEKREAEINRIQQEVKDSVWLKSAPTANNDFSAEMTEKRLENILVILKRDFGK